MAPLRDFATTLFGDSAGTTTPAGASTLPATVAALPGFGLLAARMSAESMGAKLAGRMKKKKGAASAALATVGPAVGAVKGAIGRGFFGY